MRSFVSLIVIVVFLSSTVPLPAQERSPEPSPRPYLAIMDLQMDEALPAPLSQGLADKIRETMMSAERYLIIDRGNVEIIMREIARGQEGCYDESCAVEAGRLLSAHFIITGRVVKLGVRECQISVQMTDVARAEIVRVASDTCSCEGKELTAAAVNVALDLAGIPRKPGKVIIQSNPPGAIVYIDGERAGQTPFNTRIKPGQHKVMVTMRGYEIEEQTLNIVPDVTESLNFALKKAKKKWYQTWWFYSAVGVALAGGVAGAFIAGQDTGGDGDQPLPPSNTGSIPVGWDP